MNRTSPHIIHLGMLGLVVFAAVHAYWGFGCYLVNEHRRLVWYEILALWCGDLVTAFWFFRYLGRYALGLEELQSHALPDKRIPSSLKIVIITMACGVLVELGHGYWIMKAEEAGFARAVPTPFTLEAATDQQGPNGPTYWRLQGTYPDLQGNNRKAVFFVNNRESFRLLPAAVQQAIRNQQLPIQFGITIDPERPGRCYIPQLGWNDENRFHYFSFLILLFQTIFGFNAIVFLHESTKKGIYPWWGDLIHIVPFLSEAFVFALFGGLEVYAVRRFCP